MAGKLTEEEREKIRAKERARAEYQARIQAKADAEYSAIGARRRARDRDYDEDEDYEERRARRSRRDDYEDEDDYEDRRERSRRSQSGSRSSSKSASKRRDKNDFWDEQPKRRSSGGGVSAVPILIGVGAIIVVLALAYVGLAMFFNSHFFFRSTVNGVSASAKTAEAVYDKIKDSAGEYELSLVRGDGTVEAVLTGDDLGVEVNYNLEDVQALLDGQNGFEWVSKLITPVEYTTELGNDFNAEVISQVVDGLNIVADADETEAQSAYIQYNGSSYEIVPEVYGNSINADSIKTALISAVSNLETEVNIDGGDCYTAPAVLSDDPTLVQVCDTLNSMINTNIHYDLGDGITEEIPQDTKLSFFYYDEENTAVGFDETAIANFVASMASKYDTVGSSKSLATSSGGTVTIPAGTYGWKTDQSGEAAQIKADLQGGTDVTRDFVFSQKANSHGANDYGSSYIEVNLTEQHVYVYKAGSLVLDMDCVSGNLSANHGTHTGAYFVAYKARDTVLKGDDYESFVSYWMPFHNGEGLHDADWRSNFGGTIFTTSGSHGCVNLPPSAAAKLYDIIDAGWPVLVYYTGNSEAELKESAKPEKLVMSYIDAIGTVTLNSAEQIVIAREAYDELTSDEKEAVTNLDVLEAAEMAYQLLVIENGGEATTSTDDATTTDATTGTTTDSDGNTVGTTDTTDTTTTTQ